MENEKRERVVAVLGRWQPVHLGHQAVLEALCERFERVVIGVGSADTHDYRSPFSLAEVSDMLHLSLKDYNNYELAPIPDLLSDPEWCRLAAEAFQGIPRLVTANPYVRSLLEGRFAISHPADFVPEERKIRVSATMVRGEMARGDGWKTLIAPEIAAFIIENGLDLRFRGEFGLHTLAMETIIVSPSPCPLPQGRGIK
jgi:nicotinamide-nucleotide adenylyltransferase